MLLALDGEGDEEAAQRRVPGEVADPWPAAPAGAGVARPRSWLWRGEGSTPLRLDAPPIVGLKPEGVAVVTVATGRGPRRAVLLVCDDGRPPGPHGAPGIPSRYVVIPYDSLLAWNASRLPGSPSGASATSGSARAAGGR